MIEAKGRAKRNAIVVTELPYQINKSALLQRMAEMVNDKKVRGTGGILCVGGGRLSCYFSLQLCCASVLLLLLGMDGFSRIKYVLGGVEPHESSHDTTLKRSIVSKTAAWYVVQFLVM